MQYVTDGKRKFIWLPRIDEKQFFDLDTDPGECHNLIDEPSRKIEIGLWENYLINEIEKRECGWVDKSQLVSPPPTAPLISNYKEVRYQG